MSRRKIRRKLSMPKPVMILARRPKPRSLRRRCLSRRLRRSRHPHFFPPDAKLHTSHPIPLTLTSFSFSPMSLFPPPRHAIAHGTTGGGKGDGTVLWVCQRSVRLGSVYEPAQVIFPSAEVLMQCPKRLVMKKKLKCLCNVIKGPL